MSRPCIFSHERFLRTAGERWPWHIVKRLRNNHLLLSTASLTGLPACARKSYLPAG